MVNLIPNLIPIPESNAIKVNDKDLYPDAEAKLKFDLEAKPCKIATKKLRTYPSCSLTSITDKFQFAMEKISGLEIMDEGVALDREAIKNKTYVLFNESQLKDRELLVFDGLAYYGSEKYIMDTGIKKALWVMHPEGKIYVEFAREGRIFHSSLMAGKKPLAVGELLVKDGKIILINENSTHYRSYLRVYFCTRALLDEGMDLEKTTIHLNQPPLKKIQFSAQMLLIERCEAIKSTRTREESSSAETQREAKPISLKNNSSSPCCGIS